MDNVHLNLTNHIFSQVIYIPITRGLVMVPVVSFPEQEVVFTVDLNAAVLTDNVPSGLEGQLHYGLVMVGSCLVKHGEDVLPAWTDVGCLGVDHLSHTPNHHVSDSGGPVHMVQNTKLIYSYLLTNLYFVPHF